MKKVEMEAERAEYYAHMESAHNSETEGLYRPALNSAIAAWPFIDSMMQYEHKYENKEFTSIAAIDFVLKYAPLLLDSGSLNKLESLLAERKRISRNTSDDQAANLEAAREEINQNYRLWTYLEKNPDAQEDEFCRSLDGNKKYWNSVIGSWQKMGLLSVTSNGPIRRFALATRMGQVIKAKCPRCGAIADAPKAMLLTESTCPHCNTSVLFVFLKATA